MQVYSNELYHYGVVGMKWGVRRFQDYNGKIIKYNKKPGSTRKQNRAYKVSYRLNQLSDDKARMARMSVRQRDSLNKAKDYWNAVAEGEKPTVKRGLIKRYYDQDRSFNVKTRAVRTTANMAAGQVGSMAATMAVAKVVNKKAGQEVIDAKLRAHNVKSMAVNTVVGSAEAMVGSEILSKLFGHY